MTVSVSEIVKSAANAMFIADKRNFKLKSKTKMNAREFFDLVSKMRQAQKKYFRNRTQRNLDYAKQLEKEIDNEIQRVEERLGVQASLFPDF